MTPYGKRFSLQFLVVIIRQGPCPAISYFATFGRCHFGHTYVAMKCGLYSYTALDEGFYIDCEAKHEVERGVKSEMIKVKSKIVKII